MKLLIAAAIIIGLIIAGVNTGQDLISKAEKQVAAREGQSRSTRTFAEDEFYWDKYNNTHKDVIVKGANKVYRENSRCHTLDPGSAGVSTSKGTKENPVFFVGCTTKDGLPFNVFFSKSDVEADKSMAAAAHINRGDALIACRNYAKANAMHPSTVDFSTFMDLGTTEFPNGRTRVDSSFTAKNSFNMEAKFSISCTFEGGRLIEGNIYEAR